MFRADDFLNALEDNNNELSHYQSGGDWPRKQSNFKTYTNEVFTLDDDSSSDQEDVPETIVARAIQSTSSPKT